MLSRLVGAVIRGAAWAFVAACISIPFAIAIALAVGTVVAAVLIGRGGPNISGTPFAQLTINDIASSALHGLGSLAALVCGLAIAHLFLKAGREAIRELRNLPG